MVKTHKNSTFVLRDLDGIRNSQDVILQIQETESTFSGSKKSAYLCEVVSAWTYDNTRTVESTLEELIKVNGENRKLRRKIESLSKKLGAALQEQSNA